MSAQADLVVRGSSIFVDGAFRPASVLVRAGVIEAILGRNEGAAAHEFEAGDSLVLPGLIDIHVHFDQPQYELAENYYSGTVNAALGGNTFVVEHPFAAPVTITEERYAVKMRRGEAAAVIDFGLWGALTEPSLPHMAAQRNLGAAGFKAFMPDNDMNFPPARPEDLAQGLAIARDCGGIVLVHAEDRQGLVDRSARLRAAGRSGIEALAEARPPELEVEAVRQVLEIAERVGGAVHFVHLSVPEAVELVTRARERGMAATCEVTAHHLLLDQHDLASIGPFAACAPPLRERDSVDEMWGRLLAGEIQAIVSDHCGYTVEEKRASASDVLSGPFGIQSVKETAVLVLEEALSRGIPIETIVPLFTSQPAELFGYDSRKGSIRVGADADFAVLAASPGQVVRSEQQAGPDRWSPYEGRRTRFAVTDTFCRGSAVVSDGVFVGRRGAGRFLPAGERVHR